MKKSEVAILDFGSSKIRAVVAERGVNRTYIIKGQKEFDYDGFEEGLFINEDSVRVALMQAVSFLKDIADISKVYIGVPGEFTGIIVKDSQISFSQKKKIGQKDIDALFDSAFVSDTENYTLYSNVSRSAVIYELDDFRRLANPIGQTTGILKGRISFILFKNYFLNIVLNYVKSFGVKDIELVSIPFAESMYLIEPETRDRIAMMVDVGYITTTFSIVQGDGIIFQYSFNFGGGYITANISDKFNVDFDVAEALKRKVNISSLIDKDNPKLVEYEGKIYKQDEIVSCITDSISSLSETIKEGLEQFNVKIPEYVPLFLTGGGITFIRGAKQLLSKNLGITVDVLTPKVPMHENAIESSVFSLLDFALNNQ